MLGSAAEHFTDGPQSGVGGRGCHTPWSQAKHADRMIVASPPMATLLMFRRLAGRRLGCDDMLFCMSVIYTAQPAIMLEQEPAVSAAH